MSEDHFIDDSFDETEQPVSNPGVKLSPNEHAEFYDVVCSFQVLEHIDDTRRFIYDSLRCLKPGGRLIQSVPNEGSFLGCQSNNILNMPPHHATRWTTNALSYVAKMFNLEMVAFELDSLADMHIRGYSMALIENSVNAILGRKPRTLDSLFASVFVKAPVRLVSLALEKGLSYSALRPAGHSITAIYRKH